MRLPESRTSFQFAIHPGIRPMANITVNQLVLGQKMPKMGEVVTRGQLAVDQQQRSFDEAGPFGKLLDRNAAVTEYAFLAIDERDFGTYRSGVTIAFVQSNNSGFISEFRDVNGAFILGASCQRQFDVPVTNPDFCHTCRVNGFCHVFPRFGVDKTCACKYETDAQTGEFGVLS
jgi:hypothetical protein